MVPKWGERGFPKQATNVGDDGTKESGNEGGGGGVWVLMHIYY
jgi:hypothetical protein